MRLVPESSSLARWLVLPFLLMAVAGLAAVRRFPDLALAAAHCPLRDLTGLPCPTCGGTHAAVALAAGRLGDAFAANPLVPLGAALVALWAAWALLAAVAPTLRVRLRLGPRETRAARVLAALLIVLLWARQIVVLR